MISLRSVSWYINFLNTASVRKDMLAINNPPGSLYIVWTILSLSAQPKVFSHEVVPMWGLKNSQFGSFDSRAIKRRYLYLIFIIQVFFFNICTFNSYHCVPRVVRFIYCSLPGWCINVFIIISLFNHMHAFHNIDIV